MTAYVHIGIAKTGTTSIQNFLQQNYELLLKAGFLYPKLLHGVEEQYSREWTQHRELAFIIKATKVRGLTKNEEEKINLFRKEISGSKNVIISSEVLHDSLIDEGYISHCRNFLHDLGFEKIKIVVYLREPADLFQSICSQSIKNCYDENVCFKLPEESAILDHRCSHAKTLSNWGKIFGKDNLIVKLFDKHEFIEQDLLKDFISCLNIPWNNKFIIPAKTNESLDVIGCEILRRVNRKLPLVVSGKISHLRGNLLFYIEKYFSNPRMKISPPKNIYEYYNKHYNESHKFINKEFFPYKEKLFPKKDLNNYKENYEIKEMKPEYWDKIAEFIVDIVSTKNQTIQDQTNQIQNLNQTVKTKNQTIQDQTNQIQNLNQTVKTKNQTIQDQTNQIQNLNQTVKTKNQTIQDQTNQIQNLNQTVKTKNQTIQDQTNQIRLINNRLNFQSKYGTVKTRIQNQLSYKLGQTMIINSKTLFGCLTMPIALLSVVIAHKLMQKNYKNKIKKDSSLILPPLEVYPDYEEAIKFKNHLSYRLGEDFIRANKNWYKGGYFYFLLKIKKYN